MINIIGNTAFPTSSTKVENPIILLPVLRAFVAPIFPEPIFLISFCKKNFVNRKPKGIDPKRYVIKITKI